MPHCLVLFFNQLGGNVASIIFIWTKIGSVFNIAEIKISKRYFYKKNKHKH